MSFLFLVDSEMNGIIRYAMVALRKKSDCKIIADYSIDSKSIYRIIVLGTIDSLKNVEGDKISINKSRYTVHISVGEFFYVCLTSKVDCPTSAIWVESCCQIFLQRLRSVYKELPLADLSQKLTEYNLSEPLKKMIEEYNQGNSCKNLTSKLEEELIEVRHILMNGVQKLIDRGERLDDLIRKTQNLEISSRDFHVVSRTRQNSKNSSLRIAVVTSILTFTLIVVLIALLYWYEFYRNSHTYSPLMTTQTNEKKDNNLKLH